MYLLVAVLIAALMDRVCMLAAATSGCCWFLEFLPYWSLHLPGVSTAALDSLRQLYYVSLRRGLLAGTPTLPGFLDFILRTEWKPP